MNHFNWKYLTGFGVFAASVMSANAAMAQPASAAEEPVNPEARNEILNDARTTPSADAASEARKRKVDRPKLEVSSPAIDDLADKAIAAASCKFATPEFDVGSAELSSEQLRELSPVAECLKNQNTGRMWIIGEADNQGTDATNWILGMQRALAVKEALQAMGVSERRLLAVSAGPTGERSVSFELSEVKTL